MRLDANQENFYYAKDIHNVSLRETFVTDEKISIYQGAIDLGLIINDLNLKNKNTVQS